MTGDNTSGMKSYRAYKRLILSILEDAPLSIQRLLLFEYETELGEKVLLGNVLKDAKNYVVHYQSGRALLINRNAPITKKIISEGDEAFERNEDRILRRKLQNKSIAEFPKSRKDVWSDAHENP